MGVNSNVLFCTGDPILDLYAFGESVDGSFKTTKLVRSYGGALNVWKNVQSILGKDSVVFANPLKSNLPVLLKDTINLYTLTRYIDVNTQELLLEASTTPTHAKESFYSSRTKDQSLFLEDKVDRIIDLGNIGLIISEYNKGAFNKYSKQRADYYPEFDFCIVDSRYRTIDLSLITTSKVKIWHATNTEYDAEFAKNFHYIFHTNASNPVRILTGAGEVLWEGHDKLLVPDTKVVNTCGAGDTFTAAVASYLVEQQKISEKALLDAAAFAIRCCQEVITTRCTTQTTIKLE